MGVRVHKAVGYGLRGFKPPPNFQELHNKAHETPLTEFVRWTNRRKQDLFKFTPTEEYNDKFRRSMLRIDLQGVKEDKKGKLSLGGHVLYDNEFGFDDALLIVPIGHLDEWYRYDSMIDWCEETEANNQDERFVPLKRELYPFDKGKPPLTVAAIAMWFGIPEIWDQLQEALYVYWS